MKKSNETILLEVAKDVGISQNAAVRLAEGLTSRNLSITEISKNKQFRVAEKDNSAEEEIDTLDD